MIYDLIIVGGGPAGISSALYAARQNLKFIFITKELGGMANYIPRIQTYLGYLAGFELVDKFKENLRKYKVEMNDEEVIDIGRDKKSRKLFLVRTKNKMYKCKSIIIATGRRFKELKIPGGKEFKGKGLSDCTACDGPLFKNKTVAVIGGGRTGIISTIFLLRSAKKIYLIERSSQIKTEGGLKTFADVIKNSNKVEIMTNTKPLEIRGEKFVKEIVLKRKGRKQVLPVEGIFVEIGYDPNTEFVKLVKKNARGEIIIDAECRTDVKGIFAAGDVTHLKEKQVIISAGEGAKALLSTVLYLEKNK